nr:hypothetical protein [Burkholderia ambifaria]
MLKSVITPVAATLVVLSGFTVTASASAQQQAAAPAIQQQSNATVAANATQLAARANDGSGMHADAAPKVVVPLRQTPARAPATPDSDCVGPVSFCNVYFGS